MANSSFSRAFNQYQNPYFYYQHYQPTLGQQTPVDSVGFGPAVAKRPSFKSASKRQGEYIRSRSKQLRLQETLFTCTKCKQALKFDDYGKRTRERLVGGSTDEICRNCRLKETVLTVGSKKWKKRKRGGTLNGGWKRTKKPKAFTLVVLLKAEDALRLEMLKRKEINNFFKITKVTLVIDPLNEGAIERTCSLKGILANMSVAVKMLGKLIAEVKEYKQHHIEFCVENENVGCLVGTGGVKIKSIREGTGATIRIAKVCLPASTCVRVKVKGYHEQFRNAVDRVIRQLSEGRKPTVMMYKPPRVAKSLVKVEPEATI